MTSVGGVERGERHWLASELARSTVVVLSGGRSAERDVSLDSGRAILEALATAPATGEPGLARVVPVEIDPRGRWCFEGGAFAPTAAIERLPHDAIFFIGLHGQGGEDGTLQGFLEVAGRRYTGSGTTASAICMDKHATRLVLTDAGLRVAPGRRVTAAQWSLGTPARERELDRLIALALPEQPGTPGWFAKPNAGGSSLLTFPVGERAELATAIERILAAGDEPLVEARIDGVELTCGVLGNHGGELRALPVVEIAPKDGRFFDYEEKYSEDGATEVCPPERVGSETAQRVTECALAAYRAAGCDGYARVDFIAPAGDAEPVVLEVNTLPGFTSRSLLPLAAAAVGIDFRALCLELCALAVRRFERRGGPA